MGWFIRLLKNLVRWDSCKSRYAGVRDIWLCRNLFEKEVRIQETEYRILYKDERPTSNIQHRTSNKKKQKYRITFLFLVFPYQIAVSSFLPFKIGRWTFDVGCSFVLQHKNNLALYEILTSENFWFIYLVIKPLIGLNQYRPLWDRVSTE